MEPSLQVSPNSSSAEPNSSSTTKPDEFPLELAEIILKGRHDPVLFTEKLLGIGLHEGQKKFLRQSTKSINLLISGNRWGKSTTIACKHIWKNFYKHGIGYGDRTPWLRAEYRTANLAPHSKLVEPVYKAIVAIMSSSFPIPQPDGSLKNNKCLIEWFMDSGNLRATMPMKIPFVNRSYVDFASTGEDRGSSISGRPYGYISFDEGGRDHHLEYAMDSNIMSRLTDWNGQLDIPCTPDSTSPSIAYHHDLFERGQDKDDNEIYSQEGSVYENTYLSAESLASLELRYKDSPLYEQVIFGRFVFAGDTIYPKADIDAARDDELNAGVAYEEGHHYVVGIDTSVGGDEMVIDVLDVTIEPFRLVRQLGFIGATRAPGIQMADFISLVDQYRVGNSLKICLETWSGESVRFYKDMPLYLQRLTTCWGSFTPEGIKKPPKGSREVKKADIIIALRKVLAEKKLKIPNERSLVNQLSMYRLDDAAITQDRVIALALACWLATDGKPKIDKIKFQEVEW